MGQISIQMPGLHNVYNALATIATAAELDVNFEVVRQALVPSAASREGSKSKGNGRSDDHG